MGISHSFPAQVAAAARSAGATLTNDVSGGSHDPAMLATLADDPDQRGVCLMHMRGTPLTMTDPELRVYAGGVVDGVAAELRDRVAAAAAAGVAPWRVLVDPGVGFAKDTAQNSSSCGGSASCDGRRATCRSCWACRGSGFWAT